MIGIITLGGCIIFLMGVMVGVLIGQKSDNTLIEDPTNGDGEC